MPKPKIITDIAVVGLLVAALHVRAIASAWYWSYWWMDIVMHFLGGLFVGLVVVWALCQVRENGFEIKNTTLVVLLGVLIVSVGWEVFEYMTGVFLSEELFPDTLYDLVFDVLGGAAALVAHTFSSSA